MFLTVSHFHPSLIFDDMTEAHLNGALRELHSIGRRLDLHPIVRTVANTLTYYVITATIIFTVQAT